MRTLESHPSAESSDRELTLNATGLRGPPVKGQHGVIYSSAVTHAVNCTDIILPLLIMLGSCLWVNTAEHDLLSGWYLRGSALPGVRMRQPHWREERKGLAGFLPPLTSAHLMWQLALSTSLGSHFSRDQTPDNRKGPFYLLLQTKWRILTTAACFCFKAVGFWVFFSLVSLLQFVEPNSHMVIPPVLQEQRWGTLFINDEI